jgi:hypothetical protein
MAVAALVVVLALGVTAWVVLRADDDSDDTVAEAVERARDAHPLLLPSRIPVRWTPQTEVSRSFFSARYLEPAGDEWFQVAIAVANPPLPDATTEVKTMSFRVDDEATSGGFAGRSPARGPRTSVASRTTRCPTR